MPAPYAGNPAQMEKIMKSSEAMLKGFMAVNGRQTKGSMARTRHGKPVATFDPKAYRFCVLGATMKGGGRPSGLTVPFLAVYGVSPVFLNDEEKLPWEWIYGMAVAAGL